MDAFIIEGGRRLGGRIRVNGAKNSALPLMAATLLTTDPVTLRDVPDLADVRNMARLLGELGREAGGERDEQGRRTVRFSTGELANHARYDIVKTMRASISVLGPLLAHRGEARVAMPGGCLIGTRPIDLHLRGLRALGADISLEGGDIIARAPGGRLRGRRIFLGGAFGSTVLGTANILCAATLAQGRTIIESAACEPEIVDLASLLTAMGAQITGAGSPRITIEGVDTLTGADHTVMPDRIEAGTLICAGAITNSEIIIDNCPLDALMAVTDRLEAVGVRVDPLDPTPDTERCACRVTSDRALHPVEVTTQPYPGFPTDLQAQLMSLLCLADGNSVISEKIFPERFMHVPELSRMGANIHRLGSTAVITGVRKLKGAPVMASDLRASAGLVLAGLAAEGATLVQRVYHLDRGYEALDQRLSTLGASIRRVDDKDADN